MLAAAPLYLPGSLAQEEPSSSVLFWALVLLGLLVVLFQVINYLRKWMRSPEQDMGSATGFTLADLRALHKAGQMTDEEFDLAKRKVVEAAQTAAARAAAAKAAQAPRRRASGVQIAQKPDPSLLNPEDDSSGETDKNPL